MKSARVLYSEGKFDDAAGKVTSDTFTEEEKPYAALCKAQLCIQRGDDVDAVDHLSETIEGNKMYADALLLRAKVYSDESYYDEAIADCTSALAISSLTPSDRCMLERVEALVIRAGAHRGLGQFDQAIDDCSAAQGHIGLVDDAAVSSSSKVDMSRGLEYFLLNDRHAILDAELVSETGRALFASGKKAEAETLLREAAKLGENTEKKILAASYTLASTVLTDKFQKVFFFAAALKVDDMHLALLEEGGALAIEVGGEDTFNHGLKWLKRAATMHTEKGKTAKAARLRHLSKQAVQRSLADGESDTLFTNEDNWLVSASGDETVRVWNASTGQQVHELKGHADFVRSAAFSSDGEWIVSAFGDNTVRVWNASTGEKVHELKGHTGMVLSAAFSSDGKWIVSASNDKTVRVSNASTGEKVHELKGHEGGLNSAAFS
jgi:tetratricopeptide (TPR) repeat protein